jgi:hypothetical protein
MARLAMIAVCLTCLAAPAVAAPAKKSAASAKKPEATAKKLEAKADGDSTMTIQGGQEGTVFKSLTVQGEDRIRLEIERPKLRVDLDPSKAPGLDWGSARDVLDRTTPDLSTPLVQSTARQPSPYVGHPWLAHFSAGAVARFRPEMQDVETWKLAIVNARGEAVMSYSGKGEPPKEIVWDGRSSGGAPVVPGLTYSYVLEARDKAGNKRNFVGQGFKVSAYRFDSAEGPILAMSARELPAIVPGRAPSAAAAPPILIEAASWLNQREKPSQPVRVTVTARNYEEAQALADFVIRSMAPHWIGDPAGLQAVAEVQTDAPEGGTIRIAPAK